MKSSKLSVFALFIICFYYGCGRSTTTGSKALSSPTEIKENIKSAASLHAEGLKLFNGGKCKEALAVWLQESKLDPNNANTYNNLGIASECFGDHETAIIFHKRAIELNPAFSHAYYSLGIAYFRKTDYASARAAFQKAIELNYNPADSFFYLGQMYQETNDLPNAIDSYKKAIKLKPDYRGYIEPLQKECEEELTEKRSVRFRNVMLCDSEKPNGFCVDDTKVDPGQTITILGEKGDAVCYAKAGIPAEIFNEIESYSGYTLVDISCRQNVEGGIAVINDKVESYKKLKFTEVKDSAAISSIDREIRKKGLLNKFQKQISEWSSFSGPQPKVFEFPSPSGKTHFAFYEPQPAIMISANKYSILFNDSDQCLSSSLVDAFIMNNRYFAVVGVCVCETDGCGNEFIEIR